MSFPSSGTKATKQRPRERHEVEVDHDREERDERDDARALLNFLRISARQDPQVMHRTGEVDSWLDCRAFGRGDDPAAPFVKRGRLALSPGLRYGREGAGFARLNFGTSPDLVAEAIRRMSSALG